MVLGLEARKIKDKQEVCQAINITIEGFKKMLMLHLNSVNL